MCLPYLAHFPLVQLHPMRPPCHRLLSPIRLKHPLCPDVRIYPGCPPVSFPSGSPVYSPAGFPADSPVCFPSGSPADFPADSPACFPAGFPVYFPVCLPVYFPVCFPVYFPVCLPVYFPVCFPADSPVCSPVPASLSSVQSHRHCRWYPYHRHIHGYAFLPMQHIGCILSNVRLYRIRNLR